MYIAAQEYSSSAANLPFVGTLGFKFSRLLPLAALLFGSMTASANSTAFNGFVQTSGDAGVDFGTLGGGNYRITMTRSGQVNFRYTIDGQTFDSNPEAAVFDLYATSDDPLGYATVSTNYTGTATVRLANPGPGELPSYTSTFHFNTSTIPSLFFPNLSFDSVLAQAGSKQLQFTSDTINLSGNVNGGRFDFAAMSPTTMNVLSTSLAAQLGNNTPGFFSAAAADPPGEAPEPDTMLLLGAALLAVALWSRRLVRG